MAEAPAAEEPAVVECDRDSRHRESGELRRVVDSATTWRDRGALRHSRAAGPVRNPADVERTWPPLAAPCHARGLRRQRGHLLHLRALSVSPRADPVAVCGGRPG